MAKKKTKIEFYKVRSFGGRLSAASDFLQLNLAVLLKNSLLLGIPISLLMGFFMNNFMNNIFDIYSSSNSGDSGFLIAFLGFSVVLVLVTSLIYSVIASMMVLYQEDALTKSSSISDMKNFLPNSFKTFILWIFILFFIFAILIFAASTENPAVIIIALLIILFLTPIAMMVFYPVYFEGLSIGESISKGFRFGFNNWGTCFLILLLVGIICGIVQYFFLIPFYMLTAFKYALSSTSASAIGTIIGLIGSAIMCFGVIISVLILFVFYAFEYFSIREEREGVSLIAKIDKFETL